MITVFDHKITFDIRTAEEMEYFAFAIRQAIKYLNDRLQTTGYLSWEAICEVLHIPTTADDIEQTSVLRYDGRELGYELSAPSYSSVMHLKLFWIKDITDYIDISE